MIVPTFVELVDAVRILARKIDELDNDLILIRAGDDMYNLAEMDERIAILEGKLPSAPTADSGPVLCPNCGEPMYWHVEHEGYTTTKFFSCGGTFSCYLDTISFTPTTNEAEAAAIVRRMRGAR